MIVFHKLSVLVTLTKFLSHCLKLGQFRLVMVLLSGQTFYVSWAFDFETLNDAAKMSTS